MVWKLDLKTRYPFQTWFNERPYADESNFERERRCFASSLSNRAVVPNLLELVAPKTLLLLDRGFWNYSLFEQLMLAKSDFITRLKSNAKYESISILSQSSTHQDERWSVPTASLANRQSRLIRLGTGSLRQSNSGSAFG